MVTVLKQPRHKADFYVKQLGVDLRPALSLSVFICVLVSTATKWSNTFFHSL